MIKIEQIAMHVPNIPKAIDLLEQLFGLTEWVHDEVTGLVAVDGTTNPTEQSKALLAFNYQLGYEFELLHYVNGPNWHAERGTHTAKPFLSHKAQHVSSVDDVAEYMKGKGVRLAQYMVTTSHTNRYLIDRQRTFKYAIFDTRDLIGWDYKVIERIEPAMKEAPVSVANECACDIMQGFLMKAHATVGERNKQYKNNFAILGRMMADMMPDGLTLKSPSDFTRWHLLSMMMLKMTRYGVNFGSGGHEDSLIDGIAFPAILATADKMAAEGDL